MDPKNKEFKKLQAQWYKKLSDSGFEDLENENGDLKRFVALDFQTDHNEIQQEAKETYYRLAGFFLHEHRFRSNLDKLIWGYHATGVSIREVVKLLDDKGIKTYRRAVHETVQRLKKLMVQQCSTKKT